MVFLSARALEFFLRFGGSSESGCIFSNSSSDNGYFSVVASVSGVQCATLLRRCASDGITRLRVDVHGVRRLLEHVFKRGNDGRMRNMTASRQASVVGRVCHNAALLAFIRDRRGELWSSLIGNERVFSMTRGHASPRPTCNLWKSVARRSLVEGWPDANGSWAPFKLLDARSGRWTSSTKPTMTTDKMLPFSCHQYGFTHGW